MFSLRSVSPQVSPSVSCQFETAESLMKRKSQSRDCPDEISLWPCLVSYLGC